jgi:DNA uptake protein ComE-like DNA-binding protein
VPGIGVKSAKKILAYRIKNKIHSMEDLESIGVYVKRGVHLS